MVPSFDPRPIAKRLAGCLLFLLAGCGGSEVDLVLRGGVIFDGSGQPGIDGDVAIHGDSIVAIGDIGNIVGVAEVDVTGLAVAPGFINMLSWATESLLEDGSAQSDIRQGVTLEVMGEGTTMGPINETMRAELLEGQSETTYEVPWTTLGEYLQHLEDKGVSVNVASFIGATTVRIHELGYEDREPTPEELERMQELVRVAMREGALGVGSSLIYAPAFYAKTPELIALMKAAAEYDGMYISHMRSEGNQLLESVDELIEIAEASGAPAEIYHLKAAGQDNWDKMDEVIRKVEVARAAGTRITADMYTYTAGATGLDASMPPWVQEGGYTAWAARLQDPAIRVRVMKEMSEATNEWENLALAAGSPDMVLLVGFRADSLRYLTGKSLEEVAAMYGTSWQETAMDLVVKDGSRVGTVYFMMSEENVEKQMALPWLSFGSDAGALATREPYTLSNPHPRAYGNFSRLLGHYVRDRHVVSLPQAIRKLAALPAQNLGIQRRGLLKPGYLADVVVFDALTIQDHATFEDPHQYSTGMVHVFVNGEQVLRDGEHTGATPGRFVKGPGVPAN